MHGSDYKLIAEHPLRNILRNVCNDPRDLPGRKALRAELMEALPEADAAVIDALMVKAEEFAKASVDPGARWDTRASADALTLHVLKSMQAADRLVPVQEEQVDAQAIANEATALSWGEAALQSIESRLPDSARNV